MQALRRFLRGDEREQRYTAMRLPELRKAGEAMKLTAEQVRETIERHFCKVAVLDDGKPVEWRDDWVCKVAIDYRAITDELNELVSCMREFVDCGVCKFYHADIQLCEYGIPPCSKFERKAVKR